MVIESQSYKEDASLSHWTNHSTGLPGDILRENMKARFECALTLADHLRLI